MRTSRSALKLLVLLVAGLAGLTPSVAGAEVETLFFEVVSRRPHDPDAFTQGLQIGSDGVLYESTGRYKRSTLRVVDAATGEVLGAHSLPDEHWGEGLAWVDGQLIQLTYKSGVATVSDPRTLEVRQRFEYEGQGWGLCYDGSRLVMSDGSSRLTFRDPATFAVTGTVQVTLDGVPLTQLNELECVDGRVWANVWKIDDIVRIDPETGVVDGLLDLDGVVDSLPATADVLNGIAWDPVAQTFLVTGKLWPEMIEIRILEPEAVP